MFIIFSSENAELTYCLFRVSKFEKVCGNIRLKDKIGIFALLCILCMVHIVECHEISLNPDFDTHQSPYDILYILEGEEKHKLRESLSSLQFEVTQNDFTEPPYRNDYYDLKDKGDYKCVICGHNLFKSDTKYDSGSGWPSFYEPDGEVVERPDTSSNRNRTEVVCGNCGAHLGHLFKDGPEDKTGMRYCINSASLKFDKGGSE
uniref:Peptide-methionine (R)-S-oxide reductase n=1 Tax=Euplotes nobilii TaxID=184062 RepID=A0A1Q1NIA4_EUPNO|nr:methionine sulfoxide reductase B [Euplotes nobilii]